MSRMYRDLRLLPVWKITADDPDHSCYYIHPETATVRYVNSTARWKYWMYTALHRLRIQGLNSSPTLRKRCTVGIAAWRHGLFIKRSCTRSEIYRTKMQKENKKINMKVLTLFRHKEHCT